MDHGQADVAADPDAHGHVDVDTVQLSAELVEAASVASHDIAEYALWLGDDSLVLAQHLGWWISRAPELEEDIALGNIALDLIGHARSLLHYAGAESGRTEDDLAYWRDEPEWRSAHLFEQPNGDFAHTIARQFIAAHYLFELYSALMNSTDATLAAIAAKAVKEVDYHRDHSIQWVLRLAQGTEESRRRMITGLSDLWPFLEELFVDEPLIDRLEGIAVRPSSLRALVEAAMSPVLAEAELGVPRGFISSGGGRRGDHSENLGPLLAELQVLARAHPGATW
ncbi:MULTISPECIES: 1,2-phenylacetyl-CoA epoxidase subunit PaaC [Cryobacterium]|uniref:Phenylacetate-CoA oxygenase subunit PaaI n=1 Tax=Cryobacterium breve TaxID=1259258 RepID=A0ABY2J0W1_9MICO|nr:MULTISPECIES: 1,2-phenylacetyl-CoA epoxidase subunit PaaC [Cryobacterium]TFC94253.1 phenylacetate-CoA oxygenase subunit PaaI [Cryobacterium sp. TmT3-12]TFC98588.1 phenylacetate-CoA oxygenase subunit PaaI [Cryobacterium breve]